MNELFARLSQHAVDDARVALVAATHARLDAQGHPLDIALSYRQLLAQVLAFGRTLQAHGVAPGACITVLCDDALHQVAALTAGLCHGVVVNLLNPALARPALEKLCRHASPALVVVSKGADAWAGVAGEAPVIPWAVGGQPDRHDEPPEAPTANDGGLLIYTSGTTGPAKGVLLRWSHIRANVLTAVEAFGYTDDWVTGSVLPRFHTFTLISDVLPMLWVGGCCVLSDTFELPRLGHIVATFKRHGVQSFSAAPIILEAFCALQALKGVPSLRHAVSGAAPLKERTRQLYAATFGHPIIPCYGLSETTCFATISPREAVRPGSAGRAAGIEVAVVDEAGLRLPAGATGELVMRGPSVISTGYFRDTQGQFAKAFSAEGWFHSGDIGRMDDDGYVYITGRRKNMVIRGGEKVYLEEVDQCVAELPPVADCASVVRCQTDQADQALSFVALKAGESSSKAQIEAHVRQRLGPRHVPDRVYFINEVPRTRTGKASQPELLALADRLDAVNAEVTP